MKISNNIKRHLNKYKPETMGDFLKILSSENLDIKEIEQLAWIAEFMVGLGDVFSNLITRYGQMDQDPVFFKQIVERFITVNKLENTPRNNDLLKKSIAIIKEVLDETYDN